MGREQTESETERLGVRQVWKLGRWAESTYLWCPVTVGEAVEAAEEEGEGIFDTGMPAGTVH